MPGSGTGITAWIGALGPAVALILGIVTFALTRRAERRRDEWLAREAVEAHVAALEAVAISIAKDIRSVAEALNPDRLPEEFYWGACAANAIATVKSADDTLAALDMGGINAVPVWQRLMRLRARLGGAHYRLTTLHEACVEAFTQKRPAPVELFRATTATLDGIATCADVLAEALAAAYPSLGRDAA